MYRHIFITLLLITTPFSILLADSHLKASKAFLEVMQPQIEKIKGAKTAVDQMFKRLPPNKQSKKSEVVDLFLKIMNDPEKVNIEANVYKKIFTEKELKQMTAFMKTDFGKKIKVKMPTVMAEAAKASKAYQEKNAKFFQKDLIKILK